MTTRTLPRAAAAAPPTSFTAGVKILLIEDNPGDLHLIRETLADAGLAEGDGTELLHAATVADARRTLAARPDLDLVLADLGLPDAEGLETFEALRTAAPTVPVVILSGFEDEAAAVEAVRAGAQDYLLKGDVSPRVLRRAIRYALERFRVTEAARTSHERFCELLEESEAGVLVLDRDGRVLHANAAAARALRRSQEAVQALTFPVDPRGDQELPVTFADGREGVLHARTTETLWDGRLAYLMAVEAVRAEDEPAVPRQTGVVSRFEGLRTASPAMRKLFATCERIAPTQGTVLVLGETGTGKELLARAIHNRSGRDGRFVAVNCASIPKELVESELFGHEKGSFTGAETSKLGLFREAEGGTIMLDEVGSLAMAAQLSLLRALQERTVRPVGSAKEVPVDVRVIAATSEPLFEAVKEGRFREDLLYRLDVLRIEVLPLRKRPEDVLHLFRHFCRQVAAQYELEVPDVGDPFLEAMVTYPWPGNVRQLENFAERLLITGGRCTTSRQFEEMVRPYGPRAEEATSTGSAGPEPEASEAVGQGESLTDYLDRLELAYMEALLEATQGRIIEAAERAGVNRRTILRKLRKHGLDKAEFR